MSQAAYVWLIDEKQKNIFFNASIKFYHDFLFLLLFGRQLPVELALLVLKPACWLVKKCHFSQIVWYWEQTVS